MKKGKLYGVGVGPGDPDMITLRAHRLINENTYLAIPGEVKEDTRSYQIVEPVIDDPKSKKIISCYVKMTKDSAILQENYARSAQKIIDVLECGDNVVYLTLGDPTVYATYMYVHQLVADAGYETEIVCGIPSFCAAAGRLGISLCERSEQLHVIPSSYDIDKALTLPGTKVLMKAASKMQDVKSKLISMDCEAYMVENCCMDNERVYRLAEEFDGNAGYLSVIIVKDK